MKLLSNCSRFKNKVKNSTAWDRLEAKVADIIQKAEGPVHRVKQENEELDASGTSVVTSNSLVFVESQPEQEISKDVKPVLRRKITAIEEVFTDDDEDVTITHTQSPPSPQERAHVQVEKYRNMPAIKMYQNPLEFYQTHGDKFPLISLLAKKYFSVSGSSVPSERVFSLAGNTISQERVRIDPEKADMLIFLSKNTD